MKHYLIVLLSVFGFSLKQKKTTTYKTILKDNEELKKQVNNLSSQIKNKEASITSLQRLIEILRNRIKEKDEVVSMAEKETAEIANKYKAIIQEHEQNERLLKEDFERTLDLLKLAQDKLAAKIVGPTDDER